MELPLLCRENLEQMTENADIAEMKRCVQRMTERYQTSNASGAVLVGTNTEVLSYAVVRMPATFGAVSFALRETLRSLPEETTAGLHTVLDLGAGTGAAAWAVTEQLPDTRVTCVERETEMLRVGKALRAGDKADVTWIQEDALSAVRRYAAEGIRFDLVTASYMTNELQPSVRRALVDALWQITGKVLLLIEPGTMAGYGILRETRNALRGMGASVAAPCPAVGDCPLSADDWCHFTVRVARSRLHKLLKGGDVPYEDEKFSYLACARGETLPCPSRILRHPLKESGKITLTLCTPRGRQETAVTKREKAAFTAARKADCGDSFGEFSQKSEKH